MDSVIIGYILGGLISLIVTLMGGVMLHRLKKTEEKLEAFSTSITELKSTAVSDSHVRKVVKEEVAPLSDSLNELLKSMHKIEVHMAEEKGFKAATTLSHRIRASDT